MPHPFHCTRFRRPGLAAGILLAAVSSAVSCGASTTQPAEPATPGGIGRAWRGARERGEGNPFEIGVPFIWCSNNLASALITQGLLYEEMTGDDTFHDFTIAQRDWLLGRNPWRTSMFTGIPICAGHHPARCPPPCM